MKLQRQIALIALSTAVGVGLVVVPVLADTTGMVTKHVYVNIEPNVTAGAMGGGSSTTDNGVGIQTGEFYITVPFRIDANREQVTIKVEATPLWKGDDPFNNDVAPIELCGDVRVDPADANPLADSNGGSRVTYVTGPGVYINGSRSSMFNPITFESSQHGHFSQDVYVSLCWDQVDPELPMGQYSGWVKLTALFPLN